MNDEYLIIDLPATRKAGTVMFWGIGSTVTTANPAAGMIVTESHLNNNLNRFDNGATTQAVLKAAVEEHKDDLESLLNFKLKNKVAA